MNKYKFIVKESCKHILRSNYFINKYIDEIDRLNCLNEEEYKVFENEKFLEIFRKAFAKSEFYKKLYTKHGINIKTVNSIEDITKLPIINRQNIQNCSKQLLTTSNIFKIYGGYTSGSTGTPLHVFFDLKTLRRYYAYILHHRSKLGFQNGDRLVSIRGRLDHSIFSTFTYVTNTMHLSSYQISIDTIRKYHSIIEKFKPKAIEGYPSSLYSLCHFLKDKNLFLNIPICFTSSETLLDNQRKLIEEVLNTRINDLYGNEEHIINLSQTPNGKFYYAPRGFSHIELDGEFPISTTLINEIFPLIRYRVDDLFELVTSDDQCKSIALYEKPIVKKIDGRIEDVIITKDGSRIGRLNFLFKEECIKFAQLIQNKPGELAIHIVPNDDFCETAINVIQEKVYKYFGEGNITVSFKIIGLDELVYTKSNKLRLVISAIT